MKSKFLNFLLILSSLLGYLEWGGNNHSFLFQAEAEIFFKFFHEPLSVLHPLVLLPLIGQIVLIVSLFQKQPSKALTYSGLGALGALLGLMFVIGLLSLNYKIVVSTLPFILVAVFAIRHYRNANMA